MVTPLPPPTLCAVLPVSETAISLEESYCVSRSRVLAALRVWCISGFWLVHASVFFEFGVVYVDGFSLLLPKLRT